MHLSTPEEQWWDVYPWSVRSPSAHRAAVHRNRFFSVCTFLLSSLLKSSYEKMLIAIYFFVFFFSLNPFYASMTRQSAANTKTTVFTFFCIYAMCFRPTNDHRMYKRFIYNETDGAYERRKRATAWKYFHYKNDERFKVSHHSVYSNHLVIYSEANNQENIGLVRGTSIVS